MSVGKPPFETSDLKSTYKMIKQANFEFPEQIVLSDELKDLVLNLLVCDTNKRFTLDQVLAHSFMNKNPIPLTIPSSTLAVPPSNGFLKHYQSSKILEKNNFFSHIRASSSKGKTERNSDKEENKPLLKTSPNSCRLSINSDLASTEASNKRKNALISSYTKIPGAAEIWIKKWVDYSEKYGIGYILSTGCVGVHFNDNSKIVSGPNESFYYICKNTESVDDVVLNYSFVSVPDEYRKKIAIFDHFKKHFQVDKSHETSHTEVVYLKK